MFKILGISGIICSFILLIIWLLNITNMMLLSALSIVLTYTIVFIKLDIMSDKIKKLNADVAILKQMNGLDPNTEYQWDDNAR